jgi:hypothetical protein
MPRKVILLRHIYYTILLYTILYMISWLPLYTILISWMQMISWLPAVILNGESLSWMLIYYSVILNDCCIYTILYWYISRGAPKSYLEYIYYTIYYTNEAADRIILLLYIYYTIILNTARKAEWAETFGGNLYTILYQYILYTRI